MCPQCEPGGVAAIEDAHQRMMDRWMSEAYAAQDAYYAVRLLECEACSAPTYGADADPERVCAPCGHRLYLDETPEDLGDLVAVFDAASLQVYAAAWSDMPTDTDVPGLEWARGRAA